MPHEQAAIRRCQQGDIEGLETLYAIYSGRVHRTCYRILGDEAAAADQTQEVFLHLFRQIRRFDGRARFSTWLYRVAVNLTINRLRRRKRRAASLQAMDRPVAASLSDLQERRVLRREEGDRVRSLLAELSSDHRTVLVLREVEDLKYHEIAEVLGIAKGTVMSRLHRARQELKRLWSRAAEGNSCSTPAVQRKEPRS